MQNNIELFVKEYKKLVEKYNVDYANYPVFVPGEVRGTFSVIVQSVPVDIAELQKQNKNANFLAKA